MKHVLVTGGIGYIGSHTVVSLVEQGFHPIVVDDLRNSSPTILNAVGALSNNLFTHISVDICDYRALKRVLSPFSLDAVIHFAAYKSVGESFDIPLRYYQNNLTGLMNVLELCQTFKIRKFVFSSSCTVYGAPNERQVFENTPKQLPESPYGFTKWMGEQILADFHRNPTPFQTICLRYFNPIGAHPSGLIGELSVGIPNNLVPYITQTAAGIRKHLTIFGNNYPTADGTCIRDFIHVCDVADAHVSALKHVGTKPLEAFNIGTGKGTSVLDLVQTFMAVSGLDLPYRYGERRSGDVAEIFANVEKSKHELGWEAQRTLEEALRDAWNWEQRLQQHD